jgi:hypothetical protein
MVTSNRVKVATRVALFVALWLAPAAVRADEAAEQFRRAITMFDEGNCEEALPLFEKAFSATQSPNARLYVARCLAQLGRLPEAYREMKGTVDVARQKAVDDDKYVKTRDAAAAELAQLEPRVGKLVVALPEAPEGATIEVNGHAIDEAERGVPFPVEPGILVVVARAPGRETVTREIEIAGGETKTVAIVLPEAGVGPSPPGEEEKPSGAGISGLQIGGIVVGVIGLGGLAAFAATGSMAKSRFDRLAEECGGVRCTDPSYADVVDEGKTLQTVANVTAVVGGVLLAGGVAMIIFGGGDDDPEVSAGAVPLPGGGAGSLRISF